jgi:biopolymer transport protein ExbB
MFHLIEKGGPIMWPLMLTSVVSLAVVLERLFFILGVSFTREPKAVEGILSHAERGQIDEAIALGGNSSDFVARVLTYGLAQKDKSLSAALMQAANKELKRFNQGLSVLDTVVTLAPLLGLLATVTGMIRAFGILGGRELDAPSVITGGIAEALIGTAFGLGIAVVALIPFNYLNAKLEEARHELEDAATHLELFVEPAKKK